MSTGILGPPTIGRLLVVTHYYSTHHGGVEIVAAQLARRLAADHGWLVEWMASDVDPVPAELAATISCLPAGSWNPFEKRFGVPWPIWSLTALIALWRSVGRAEIVHVHDALYMGSAFAAWFALLRGKPLVVTQHVGVVPYSSWLLRATHSVANHTLGKWVLSKAEICVFISHQVQRYFSKFCRFRTAPRYFANGVDTSTFFPVDEVARAALRQDLGIPPKIKAFLFVGRFVEKKGLAILRRLAAANPEDFFLFAGHGPIQPEDWGLANVRVRRGLSGATLAAIFQLADLLILPSQGEGFPLVVQEAMACGTPVLVGEDTASGCPAARPLMFVEAVGGEDTVARWAARIAALRTAPEDLAARRAAVAEFARRHWSWEAAAAAYAEAFAALSRDWNGRGRT